MGGDADRLRGGAWSIAVDCQNSNCVLCELIESLHLVVESVHLHTLNTNTGQLHIGMFIEFNGLANSTKQQEVAGLTGSSTAVMVLTKPPGSAPDVDPHFRGGQTR